MKINFKAIKDLLFTNPLIYLVTIAKIVFVVWYLNSNPIDMFFIIVVVILAYDTIQGFFLTLKLFQINSEINTWKKEVSDVRSEQSKDTNILTNEFIITASHNFRTPITGIKGYLELLDKDEVFAEDRKLYVKKMKALVQRLFELVQNMLMIIVTPNMVDMDLNVLLNRVIAETSPTAKIKNMSINLVSPSNLPHISGDMRLLVLAFENIISNAIKYGNNDTQVIVSADQVDGNLVTKITNYGIGIPADEIPMLFEKFHRAKNVLMTYEGTGLGMFITKQIILMHKGIISVTSVENKETCFSVALPLAHS